MDTKSKWFDYLHNTRRLSEKVITEAELSIENNWLRIPVFDEAGNELFAKLRRLFDKEDGPKYLYEYGSKATLYGVNFSDLGGPNYFNEGELDSLAMRTMGLNSFSSTGGAMTFKEEWFGLTNPDRQNIIIFDNDETGIKGAIKIAMMLKTGFFTWVPPVYGKDVSDLLQAVGVERAKEIILDPERQIAFNLNLHNQAETKAVVKELYERAKSLEHSVGQQFLLQLAFDIKMNNKPRIVKERHRNVDNAILDAKGYPIENLMPFRAKKHTCLWHDEKTASLHLYKDNSCFCHGSCNRQYDAIDVYMKLNNVKFMEAVEALNKLS